MSKWLIFSAITLVAATLFPQQEVVAQQKYIEGRDYVVINKAASSDINEKIEVTEVFWYGCPHCNRFQPVFEKWKQQQQDDVDVRHSPAMWNKNMVTHARIFYTAESLGKLDVMHTAIFDAMHKERKKLLSKKQIAALFAKYDVSEEVFEKTFKSFGVNGKVKKADARARSFGITGTPEVVVNGKYRTSARLAGSNSKLIDVIDYLVNKERASNITKG